MADPIFLRLGESRAIELPELVGAMGNFLGLLRDVDSTISNSRRGNLKWIVTTLADEPAPLVGVTPSLPRRSFEDTSRLVEREVINNVVSLTEKGERNQFFSDSALTKVERIAKTTQRVGPAEIYTTSKGNFTLRTSVTAQTFTRVQEMTSVNSKSFGTVAGNLDSISVHKGMEFRVWDENTKRPVRCRFRSSQILSQVKDLLARRVVVSGIMSSDRSGQPLSIAVETIDGVDLSQLPPIRELMGSIPNLTGGLSLKEYLEDTD